MKRIIIPRVDQQVEPQNVLYLIGDINYSHVHLVDGEVILSCRTLKWFANQWPSFLRLHKKALVNIDHIHAYQQASTSAGSSFVVMKDAASLAIARRRLPSVSSQLAQIGLPTL